MHLELLAFLPEPDELDEDAAQPRHTFEVFVDDSRYSVPTLYLIAADFVTGETLVLDGGRRLG